MRWFKSIDYITDPDEVVKYSIELPDSSHLPKISPHNLRFKVGSTIIILHNLNRPKLYNGKRLVVKMLMNNIIEATIIVVKFKDENVLNPRAPLIPTDLPFQFKNAQFPVRFEFAMTINKKRGQSLEAYKIHFESSGFSHGQLYVACSRVGQTIGTNRLLFERQNL